MLLTFLCINFEIINVVPRARHTLFWAFALALLHSWVEPFMLALLCSFLGLKFCTFGFALPCYWLFALIL